MSSEAGTRVEHGSEDIRSIAIPFCEMGRSLGPAEARVRGVESGFVAEKRASNPRQSSENRLGRPSEGRRKSEGGSAGNKQEVITDRGQEKLWHGTRHRIGNDDRDHENDERTVGQSKALCKVENV